MLLNYLIKIMLDLNIKNPLESTVDSNYTKLNISNSLDVNNCLFTPELLSYLLGSNKDSKVFKKEKKSLVYNYIYYNDFLYLTLIVYFLVRNYFITENNHE